MFIKIFRKNIKKNKGLTLMELLVTMAIFVLIMGVVSKFAGDIFRYEDIFSSGLTAYDEARKVLQPLASEIRSASSSSLGAYPIEETNTNSFIFFTDINNDGIKERVRYFLSGTILMRGVIVPAGSPLQYSSGSETTTEIVHGVRNGSTPIFTYYDTNYNGGTSPLSQPVSVLSVRLVKITLIIDDNINKPPASVTVTTQVAIRNLKDNL